jgi:hypothetical protein
MAIGFYSLFIDVFVISDSISCAIRSPINDSSTKVLCADDYRGRREVE